MSKSADTLNAYFDKLYKEYNRLVMQISLCVLGDFGLAEDAFQATFITLARNVEKIDDTPEKARGYVTKIARNCAIDIYRRNRKILEHEIPFLAEGEEDDTNGHYSQSAELSAESFEDKLFEQWERIRLLEALDKLDKKHSAYIKDYYFDRLSFRQIAEKYEINLDAAKKRVYRSIEKLKDIFI